MTVKDREDILKTIRERQSAVRGAWKREIQFVKEGRGSQDWSREQQKELIKDGKIKNYVGQHMKSVSDYPGYAGSPENIQLLTPDQHLAAHNSGPVKSGYRSPTNGYYDVESKQMYSFGNNPPSQPKPKELSHPLYKKQKQNKTQEHLKNQNKSKSLQWIQRGGS